MGKLTHTVSGSIASFKSADKANIESLKVYFNSIQSGSGDPSPENIREISGQTQLNITHCGINLIDKDNITIVNKCYRNDNGIETSTQNSFYISTMIRVKPLTYYTVTIASVHYSTRFYFLTKDGNWISRSAGYTTESAGLHNVWTQTPENCELMQLQFYKDSDISFLQVEEGKTKGLQNEIYNGKTLSVIFPATGKNLFNSELELGGISITDGSDVETNTRIRTKGVIPIIVSQTHTISASGMYSVTVYGYDENMVFIGANRNKVLPYTFTFTKPNIKYVRFSFSVDAAGSVTSLSAISNVQLEYGSTATTYESVNNAFYGGYIDLVNGTLVQTHAKFIEDGSENVNVWEQTVRTNFIAYSRTDLSTLGILQPYIGYKTAIFNYCTSPLTGGIWEGAMGTGGANSANHNNDLRLLVPTSFSTISSLLAYFSEHPLEVVYELQTPIIYQLTPQQMKTILGQNNIWSNANGDIECTYEFTDHMAKRRLELNTPHIETISNSFVSFNTDLSAYAKDAKIYFNPIQSGEGDPSSSNIRNLVAWSNIKLRFLNDYLPIIPNNPQQIYYSNDNKYRMEYTTNGKFKLLDTIAAGDYPTFDINIVPIIYPEDGNRILAISDIKTSIGAWNLTFSLRDSDNAHKMNGYFEFGSTAQALCVVINDTSTIRNVTYTLIKLIFSNAIPKDTEFILGITNSSNIVSQDINFSSTPIYGGYVDLTEKQIYSNYYQLSTSNLTSDIVHKVSRFTDYDAYYFGITNLDVIPASDSEVPNMFFEDYKTVSWDERMNNPRPGIAAAVAVSGGTRIQIFTEKDAYETVEDFIASLANRVILFKRLSPLSYSIESQPLNIYKGTNNIWTSSNGNIEIKYWTH